MSFERAKAGLQAPEATALVIAFEEAGVTLFGVGESAIVGPGVRFPLAKGS